GDLNGVKGRIGNGEDAFARDEDQRNALHWAASAGHVATAEYLLTLDGGKQAILAADDSSATPLHIAVAAGRVDVARLLLAQGADPLSRNSKGQTPLHLHKARPAMLEIMLPYYSVDHQDTLNGSTPLHRACSGETEDHITSISMLIEAGARLEAQDHEGAWLISP
ncbi:unnamed protein product, partial [Chrysoparadoxa australica]